ncbi:NRDE family protein [Modestobacter roseus]|uniref:NRDE family protein n=1 Tax=Modestobacter roseus TaxID=1181884 RepID=UPI0034DDECB6
MCTVVVRRSAGRPAAVLAVRDEVTTRGFDDPGRWWPQFPDVVGGRDHVAGGTWCATSVGTGRTALVLNRHHDRPAAPGAPSRGMLPLLGATRGPDWTAHVRLAGMAGFLLVLVDPDRLTSWDFDGDRLVRTEHPEGTHLLTSGGPEDRKADRWLADFAALDSPGAWRGLLRGRPPADDPSALVVRHERGGRVYGTVFAETLDARPGRLVVEHSRRPWADEPWQIAEFGAAG